MTDIFSQFDKELIDFNNGKITGNHIFNLGLPDTILQKCGFPAQHRIELTASRISIKAKLHHFEPTDLLGLDKALQKPIAYLSIEINLNPKMLLSTYRVIIKIF